ncbi:MAG: tetratricopeptide repeat protein [Planctomycetaceae bacterium]|nr:tetratricopeptide repeat protein [Planctomycetaceae bacterium]
MTAFVYWHAPDLGFVSFDDPVYFAPDLPVWKGLTPESVRWMFTESYFLNWHPVTWLSYMLDVKLFGKDNPGAFHVTNVVLHTANVLLLYITFWRMTGDQWKSAFVAAVFAVHPLHVESVAWLSERKDLLSTFFGLSAILAYVLSVQRSSRRWFWASWAALALSLMSKQMFVTLPFLLLLLDYWPLRRWSSATIIDDRKPVAQESGTPHADRRDAESLISWKAFGQLVLEKWPFFVLTVAACVIAVATQQDVIVELEDVSLWDRLQNVVCVYVLYVFKTIWPSGLAVYYPFPADGISMIEVAISGVLLAVVTYLAYRQAVAHPYFLIGWLWYLGMLVPVIGIVQIGTQRMADRYTYVPGIGLTVIAAWLVPALVPAGIWRRYVLPALATAVVLAFMSVARMQTAYWQDGIVLFERVLSAVGPNAYAHTYLGIEFENRKRPGEAIQHYREALRLDDNYPKCEYRLAVLLSKLGRLDEAIPHYQEAIRLAPHYGDAHNNLGLALMRRGRSEEAIVHFREAVRFGPNYATGLANLGNAFCQLRQFDEGIKHYEQALRLMPDYARAHYNLGHALLENERYEEAIIHLREAGRLDPRQLSDVEHDIAIAEARRQQLQEAMDKTDP